jgi:hypothetical protein
MPPAPLARALSQSGWLQVEGWPLTRPCLSLLRRIALENDGSLAFYTGKELKEYLRELAESLKKGAQPEVIEEHAIHRIQNRACPKTLNRHAPFPFPQQRTGVESNE